MLRVAGVPHLDDEVVLDVLLRENGCPRRDPSDERHDHPLGVWTPASSRGAWSGLSSRAPALEVRELRVDARDDVSPTASPISRTVGG